ncbi:MAG: class I SAM-dependent methyltransferase [Paludibacteraceae bacterium]|nr:class I SAM-dependent methyltransferase [Paludibacteraceae bacterium]
MNNTDSYTCKICKNTLGNQPIKIYELAFGSHDEFIYFKCPECGCLQIAEVPQNVAKYYPSDQYYSYRPTTSSSLKNMLHRFLLSGYYHGFISEYTRYVRTYGWASILRKSKISKAASILDVGCGSGHALQEMHAWGYTNLTGIDPFIEKEIFYPSGVRIYKTDIYNYKEQKFDLIMMHHSFEHMDNPSEVLTECYKLLNPGGRILIRIPVVDCYAYRKYGINWFQIDSPRHFYLHTTSSMSLLAKQTGFTIEEIKHDSRVAQFINSEKYIRNITLPEDIKILQKDKKMFQRLTKFVNATHDGDQACFILKKQ